MSMMEWAWLWVQGRHSALCSFFFCNRHICIWQMPVEWAEEDIDIQVLQISSAVGNVDLISQSPYYWQTQKKEGRMAARSLHGKTLQTCPCVLLGLWPERQGVLNSDFWISGCMLRLWMCGKHSAIPGGEFPLSHFFITVRIATLLLGYVCSVVWASFLKE